MSKSIFEEIIVTVNADVIEALDKASTELNALNNRLLALMSDIGDNTNALFALDDARKGIARSQHDLRRVKTRLISIVQPVAETEKTK